VVFGPCDPSSWHPDLDWLQRTLDGPSPPRMAVLVNPCNPTGKPYLMFKTETVEGADERCCFVLFAGPSGRQTMRHVVKVFLLEVLVRLSVCFATGVLLDRAELERASQMCAAAGAWLIVDNTYEHFVYDGGVHICVSGSHVINLFSFSKVGDLLQRLRQGGRPSMAGLAIVEEEPKSVLLDPEAAAP